MRPHLDSRSHPAEIRKLLPDSTLSPDAGADHEWIADAKNALSKDGRMTAEAHAAAVRVLTSQESAKLNGQELFTNEFLR